uniref:Protein kinase domain-containing protein n=1 Tax=Panagrolaimus sp. PS1159 TaxID=55785 RepID=A0AC35GZ82_9BILA
MSTKKDKYSFIEQSFTTSENQYYNVNLNQSKKCATLIPVQFNSKPNNDKCHVSDKYEEKEKLQLRNKFSRASIFSTLNENNNDLKKRWKNENTLKTTNKSTLSLHIAAYESSTKAAGSDLCGNIAGLRKQKLASIKERCFSDYLKSGNPFEFPRQQNGDQKDKPEVMQLTPSQQLQPPTGKFNYGEVVNGFQIKKKLGEGGFGAVYEVVNVKTGLSYAMKTELVSEGFKLLKMEVYVMRQANTIKAKHIVTIEDTGSFSDFLYVVMTMVGKSLQDIRKMCPGQKFSLGTALSVGIQSLEAIEELHQIGFLHRQVFFDKGEFTCCNRRFKN